MFGIKNLLKISVFLIIIILLFSCKPRLIPEERKEASGYYAYKTGDSLKMYIIKKDSIDTLNLGITNYGLAINQWVGPGFESLSLSLENNNSWKLWIYVYIEENRIFSFVIHTNTGEIDLSHLKILNYYNNLEIDGKSYDNVYYLADTLNPYSMYSSKNYGFIKVWNDTITFKFEKY